MNGAAHRVVAGGAIGLFLANQESRSGQTTVWPLAGGLAGSVLTCLPDWLEPAVHPHHRQFFHSVVIAGLLGAGFVKLRDWQPETSDGVLWRRLGLLAIAGYLIHLVLDATTAKSLPLLGKL